MLSIGWFKFRYFMTRAILWLTGMRVEKWRREVVRLWNAPESDFNSSIESLIGNLRPANCDGKAVRCIDDLKKSGLMRKTDSPIDGSKRRILRTTSGTTGSKKKIYLNRHEISRMLAVRDYCFELYGIRYGDREARFWGRGPDSLKGRAIDFTLNRKRFDFEGRDSERELLSLIKYNPKYIYGYSSKVLDLAKRCEQFKVRVPNLKCIICTAETISSVQKRYISRVMGVSIAEEYGATEFDIIAFECPEGHRHLVNPWLIVEEDNGVGVVSDVSRVSQSIIRYSLGDSINVDSSNCKSLGSRLYISRIEGRSINRYAYTAKGERFHATEFSRIMGKLQENNSNVFEFRVVQIDFGVFDIYLKDVSGEDALGITDYVRSSFNKRFKEGIDIKLRDWDNYGEDHKQGYFIQKMEV